MADAANIMPKSLPNWQQQILCQIAKIFPLFFSVCFTDTLLYNRGRVEDNP